MKKQTLRTIVSIAIACVGLGMAPTSNAAHYTNYLDSLTNALQAKLDSGTLTNAAQTNAVNSALTRLNQNTKTLSQDLSAFGSAVSTLDGAVADHADVTAAETTTFNAFLGEAEAQLADVEDDADTLDPVPPALQNALNQARIAHTNATTETNSLSERITDLRLLFTKIKVAQIQLAKANKGHKEKAPDSLAGRSVTVSTKGGDKITLADDGTYTTEAESGTWSYTKTSANTGTITLTATGGTPTHTLDVTFKNPNKGTFTNEAEGTTGSIKVSKAPKD
jgi:hypothetical protein